MKICKELHCDKERAPGRSRCWSDYYVYRNSYENPTLERTRSYEVEESNMKILLLDIETRPNVVYAWDLFKITVGVNQIIETGDIMCLSAKWLGSPETMFFSEWGDGREKMVQAAWNLLDEADAVIHYYGSRFDIPWLYRTFLENGLTPPSPFKQVDLKNAVAKTFKFTSNKLQHISKELGLEGKMEHEGFDLWTKCIKRDPDALVRMEAYNRRDTELLEELYLILLPWIPNLPSRHLYDGNGGCPTCGKDALVEAGIAYTKVSRYFQWRCESCSSFFRSSRRIDGVQLQQVVR